MPAQGPLWIQDGRYEIADPDTPRPLDGISVGPVLTSKGLAEVFTNIEDGEIDLTIDVRETPPAQVDTAMWDAVFEVSVTSSAGELEVRPFPEGQPPSWSPSLANHGPGTYRVRCHGRTGPGGEEHLLIVWPAPHQPPAKHKVSSSKALPMGAPPPPHPGQSPRPQR